MTIAVWWKSARATARVKLLANRAADQVPVIATNHQRIAVDRGRDSLRASVEKPDASQAPSDLAILGRSYIPALAL